MGNNKTKAEILYSLGGACPGDVPFRFDQVWDVSRDWCWGTCLLEIYVPDERHGNYWPQISVRLIRQDLVKAAGRRAGVRPVIPRAEIQQDGYFDVSVEGVWMSCLDTEKLQRAFSRLERLLEQRRAAWGPTAEESQLVEQQLTEMRGASALYKEMRPEIQDIPGGDRPLGGASAELEALRAELESTKRALAEASLKHARFLGLVRDALSAT